jgi:Ser/Thr protein kinase RdoA (MazF antagonist)
MPVRFTPEAEHRWRELRRRAAAAAAAGRDARDRSHEVRAALGRATGSIDQAGRLRGTPSEVDAEGLVWVTGAERTDLASIGADVVRLRRMLAEARADEAAADNTDRPLRALENACGEVMARLGWREDGRHGEPGMHNPNPRFNSETPPPPMFGGQS